MTPSDAPALEVEGLGFRYPGASGVVLEDLSLRIESGERVALLGPNGSGKTTFVLHLNGLIERQVGSVTVGGLPVEDGNLREIRRRVGMVFQDPDDQLFLQTVRDDVAFGPSNLGLRGAERDQRVDDALAAVGHRDLDRAVDEAGEAAGLVIEVAPHKRRLAGVVHKRRNFFAAFYNRPASFLSLLIKSNGWQRKKKPVGRGLNVNHMLNLC